jgi:acetoin utilization deacetylase AcuC-like enzyme
MPVPVPVIRSDAHLAHDGLIEFLNGTPVPCFESPARAVAIERALSGDPAFAFEEPDEHGLDPILALHDQGMVTTLADAWDDALAGGMTDGVRPLLPDAFLTAAYADGHPTSRPGRSHRLWSYAFDTATPLVAGTYLAARVAVDAALTAVDRVRAGAPLAYALCRPPGHHAGPAMYGGYCFFNNAAIAAQALVAGGAARVAILDIDYHHGNGTQQLFYRRGDVLYLSLHADPARAYPYYSGTADERGTGEGEGLNRNWPLPERADGPRYLAALDEALTLAREFAPDAPLIISAGFDTFHADPIADLALVTDDYRAIGAAARELALPTVVVQEGGYAIDALGANVRSLLDGLRGA